MPSHSSRISVDRRWGALGADRHPSLPPGARQRGRIHRRLLDNVSRSVSNRFDDRLAPIPVTNNPLATWFEPSNGEYNGGYYLAPPDNQDSQFRHLTSTSPPTPTPARSQRRHAFQVVGRYDPRKLHGFSALSRLPMQTYYPPVLEPGNAATQSALHGRPLQPSQNLGGYIEQSPLLLTSLSAMKPLLSPSAYTNLTPREIHPRSA